MNNYLNCFSFLFLYTVCDDRPKSEGNHGTTLAIAAPKKYKEEEEKKIKVRVPRKQMSLCFV